MSEVIYLVISGSQAVVEVPQLIPALGQFNRPLYTLLTENARRVLSPFHLTEIPGHRLIDSYFDPALMPDRAPGLTLVAPATFNTVNKMGQGIADTLAHSLVAEAIGAGWPVVVAPAVNTPLADHPQLNRSLETLRGWGVTIVPPRLVEATGRSGQVLTMATVADILAAVESALA